MSVQAKTKILVFVSILGIIASFFTQKAGVGEIYPFFHWKLYSQPSGKDSVYCVQRLLIIADGKAVEFNNDGSQVSKEEYFYVGNQLKRELEVGRDRKALVHQLNDWGTYLAPNASCYQLAKTCYDPVAYAQGAHEAQYEIILSTCD